MNGDIDMKLNTIKNISGPLDDTDAVSKKYIYHHLCSQ